MAAPTIETGTSCFHVQWDQPSNSSGKLTYELSHYCGIFCDEHTIPNIKINHATVCASGKAHSVKHGYQYKFKVRAKNAYGWGAWSDFAQDAATKGKLLCE